METEFLFEKSMIDCVFNQIKRTVYVLISAPSGLKLYEQNLTDQTILNTFTIPNKDQQEIKNKTYNRIHPSSFESHFLFYLSNMSRLFLILPRGYVCVYDLETNKLEKHFQCYGKKTYEIRSIVGSVKHVKV